MPTPLAWFAAYLVAHFLAYLALRHTAALRSEKGIFLYHFISGIVVGLTGGVVAVLDAGAFGLSGFVLAVSLHGIYSVCFLELWSLAQGGYSLSILASLVQAAAAGKEPDLGALEAIGHAKQASRVVSLERLGLIARMNERIALTASGRLVAVLLHLLRRWVEPGWHRDG